MTDGSSPRKLKLFPVLFLLVLGILFILFAFIASLPTILSSTWGKNKLFGYLKSRYHVDVSCQRLSLEWFGHLEVTDLKVIDAERKCTFNCDIIKTEAHLWDLLFKKNFGHLYFDRAYLQISPTIASLFTSRAPKVNGMQKASLFPLGKGQELLLHFSLPYVGTVDCTYGKIELIAEGMEPIVFDDITLNVENSPAEHAVFGHLACSTLQKGIKGSMHADASCVKMNTDMPMIKLRANISQLPVQGVDELASLFEPRFSGLLVNALGNTADVALNGALAEGNFEVDLSASSPLLNAQLAMATDNGRVSLKKPAQFTYTVTPAFFNKLVALDSRMNGLSLQSNGMLQIALTQFSSAIPHSADDLMKASFDAEITTPAALSFECNHTPIALSGLNVHAASANGSMQFDGQASLMSTQKNSSVSFEGLFNPFTHDASFSARATDMPTDILGKIAGLDKLSALIGPTITLTASKDKSNLLNLEAQSPLLTLQKAVFEINDRLTLRSPAAFSYNLTPSTLSMLKEPASLQGRINTFSLPLKASIENAQFDLEASSDHVTIGLKEPFAINNLVAKVSVHTLDQVTLSLSSDRVQANLAGKYQLKTGKITLTEPLVCTAAIDNAVLHNFIDTPAALIKPADFKLSIDPFSFAPGAFSLNTLALKGSASIGQLSMLPFAGSPEISMQNLNIPFQWDGPQKIANLGLLASVQEKEQSLGSFVFKSAFSNVQWDKLNLAAVNASLEVQQLPSAFLDSLIGRSLFTPLVGPQFSTTLKIQSTPQQQNLALTLVSPLLNIKSAIAVNGNTLALAGPAQIQWTLNPEGYRALDKLLTRQKQAGLGFELKEPTRFLFSLAKLELPLATTPATTLLDRIPKIRFDLSMLQLIGEGTNPSIAFFDNSSHETIAVSSLTFSFNKSLNVPLTFACEANIASQNSVKNNPTSKAGSLSLKGSIDRLFDEKGQMHWDALSSDISLQVKSFPSRLLDLFARLKGRTDYPFTKVFGNMIQASLQATLKNLSGPVSLNVNSPNVRFSLKAVASSGALLLEEPIYAQMKITKEMSTLLLKEVNPLGVTYFYSENPVTIEIPDKGFYLPLNPFNLGLLTIPKARIELGKVACRNEGNIHIALGLLKTKQFEKNREMLLWFAPMDLHISKGVAEMERTEILLAEVFDIALWGKVLLLDNYVDMVLGLTAPTLNKAFGIKNLPDDYVLTIPMKGPMDNVQINSTKATAKIALILAAQQKVLQESMGKSPAGALLGGLLQHMATLPDNGKVPPAKHPFPWERNASSVEEIVEPREKKVHFKQKEKPLKQLMKVMR